MQEILGVAQNLLIPMDISNLIKVVTTQLSIMTEMASMISIAQ